jgi:hypothetical protein
MKLPEKVREWWPLALITAILSGIASLLTSIYKDAAGPFLEHVLPTIKNQTLLLLCLMLVLACMLLAAWLLFFLVGDEKERLRRHYRMLPDPGYAVHYKTGQRVCSGCLIKGTVAPLVKGWEDGVRVWMCVNDPCKMEFPMKTPDEE